MTLATVQNATGIVQLVPAMEELVAAAETPEQVKDALDDVDQFEVFAKRFGVDNLVARISIWRIDLRRKRAVEPETRGRGKKLIQNELISQVDRTRDRQLAAVPEKDWQEIKRKAIESDKPVSVDSELTLVSATLTSSIPSDQLSKMRAAAKVLDRKDVVRIAQILINECETAIVDATPPQPTGRASVSVAPGVTEISKVTLSKMRGASEIGWPVK